MRIPRHAAELSRFVRLGSWSIGCLIAAALLSQPLSAHASQLFQAMGDGFARVGTADQPIAKQLPPTLDCSSPLPLALGDVVTGDTTGIPSEVDQYGCVSYLELGGEIVYRLEITTPARFEITVESSADLDVVILSGCDPLLDCLALGDTGVRTAAPVTGSYYVVVDGYMNSEGPFTLRVQELIETEVPQLACETLLDLQYEDTGWPNFISRWVYDGFLCGGDNNVDGLLCGYNAAPGTEDFFSMQVGAGSAITVHASMPDADLVLWLLGGCGDQTECLAFADEDPEGSASTEDLYWFNPEPNDRVVYVVVDQGTGSSGCHTYLLDVRGNVSVETRSASWSILKASFGTNSSGGARP